MLRHCASLRRHLRITPTALGGLLPTLAPKCVRRTASGILSHGGLGKDHALYDDRTDSLYGPTFQGLILILRLPNLFMGKLLDESIITVFNIIFESVLFLFDFVLFNIISFLELFYFNCKLLYFRNKYLKD